MAELVAVQGATVKLSPVVKSLSISVDTHVLSIVTSGPLATVDDLEILLEKDVDSSFATYVTPYDNAAYVGGVLKYSKLTVIEQLSTITTKDGDPIVLKKTTGKISCTVTKPAQDPAQGTPDPVATYDLEIEFTDVSQSILTSD